MRRAILLAAVLMVLMSVPAASAAQKNNGWLMDQVSEEFGITRTELTHDALRLKTEDFTVIVKGPKYSLCIVNNKTHRYLLTPDYNGHDYGHLYDRYYELKKANSDPICGLKADRYMVFRKKTNTLTVEFWTTDQFKTTTGLNDACTRYFSMAEMPPGHGMLLRCVKLKPSGIRYRYVDTTSIKPVYVPPSTFTSPKNYELVKSFVDLQATRHASDKDVDSLFKEPEQQIRIPVWKKPVK